MQIISYENHSYLMNLVTEIKKESIDLFKNFTIANARYDELKICHEIVRNFHLLQE